MKVNHLNHALMSGLCLLILLAGCSIRQNTPDPNDLLEGTALYRTSEAMVTEGAALTQTIQSFEATGISAAKTAAYTPSPIPTIDRTRPVIASPTKVLDCNKASPGTPLDITIRDDTEMSPGQSFTKTWRLQNVGSCKWTRLYKLVFFSGNSMDAIQSVFLPGEVMPGAMIDLSIDFIAPSQTGIYQSNWMLQDDKGLLFGLGPNGDAPFWCRIQVVQNITPTLTPTITITPTPIIYLEGTVSLTSENALDLDSGYVNPETGLGDITYTLTEQGHVITPINGAGIVFFGEYPPEFVDCRYALVGSQPVTFAEVDLDAYLCYRTNQGLPGRLRLLSFDEVGDILKLEFITWALP